MAPEMCKKCFIIDQKTYKKARDMCCLAWLTLLRSSVYVATLGVAHGWTLEVSHAVLSSNFFHSFWTASRALGIFMALGNGMGVCTSA